MRNSRRKERSTFNEINITPLTDIFLVLLIIMMVIAPLLDQQGLSLMVPSNSQAEAPKKQKIITVDVNDKSEIFVEGKKVSESTLMFSIKEALIKKKDGLLIQTAGDATHGAIVKVMDEARNAGVLNISVIER